MAGTAHISSIDPGEVDAEIAGRTARRIRDYLSSHPDEDPLEIQVEGDANEVLVVPRAGATMLAQVMSTLANGQGVALIPSDAQLTTQQAADMINVSRPFLIGLLESGKIPYRKVGRTGGSRSQTSRSTNGTLTSARVRPLTRLPRLARR